VSILTSAQLSIQRSAREFVAQVIMPHARKFDISGDFPGHLPEAAKQSQAFAMAVPREYGGLGYDALTQALVLEEWGYGCAGMGTTLAASILSTDAVLLSGTEEQKRRYFAPMVNGEIAAFGLTEAGAGSDVSAGRTTALRTEDVYVINGTKCWITNGGVAGVYVIFALTDPSKDTVGRGGGRRRRELASGSERRTF
jgi:alkylation response protein AidB-like acyl-CoA dehydrogenase